SESSEERKQAFTNSRRWQRSSTSSTNQCGAVPLSSARLWPSQPHIARSVKTLLTTGFLLASTTSAKFDSGGPLYDYNTEKKQFVMGIVSYGKDCGRTDPAVNTKVSSFLNWIQSQLPSKCF
ncbi:unnamed protein product, partial [Nesidiocoris tenuis]